MKYQLGQITKSFCENHDKGKLVSHDLYRGIQLSFISLESDDFSFHYPVLDHILAINYCHSGRIEWQMGNGNSVYLSPGDFSLHTMDSCTFRVFTSAYLPRRRNALPKRLFPLRFRRRDTDIFRSHTFSEAYKG